MVRKTFHAKWLDGGRPPQVEPNPEFPDGIDVVIPRGETDSQKMCRADIPYPPPHKNIGQWLLTCSLCGFKIMMTAASRPDDPKSVTFPCAKHKMKRAVH
jgi:hypothetical protein